MSAKPKKSDRQKLKELQRWKRNVRKAYREAEKSGASAGKLPARKAQTIEPAQAHRAEGHLSDAFYALAAIARLSRCDHSESDSEALRLAAQALALRGQAFCDAALLALDFAPCGVDEERVDQVEQVRRHRRLKGLPEDEPAEAAQQ